MRALAMKADLLDERGYVYNFDREIYVNRKAKKVFSMDFIEDHGVNELEQCMDEETGGTEWRFYFNDAPSRAVQRELENMLADGRPHS
jgi:hypothetical protein